MNFATATRKPDIDRKDWPAGPWDEEADQLRWMHAGLDCVISRCHSHLCGYVGVPSGHPLFGIDHDKESPALVELLEQRKTQPLPETAGLGLMLNILMGKVEATPDCALDVHGGITYVSDRAPGEPAGEKLWWFGFDADHSGDIGPSDLAFRKSHGIGCSGTYKTVAYMKAETESLAEQLASLLPVASTGEPHSPETPSNPRKK